MLCSCCLPAEMPTLTLMLSSSTIILAPLALPRPWHAAPFAAISSSASPPAPQMFPRHVLEHIVMGSAQRCPVDALARYHRSVSIMFMDIVGASSCSDCPVQTVTAQCIAPCLLALPLTVPVLPLPSRVHYHVQRGGA